MDNTKIKTEMRSKCKAILPDPVPAPTIMKWLQLNYELADGVCIPRSTLYVHYLDFCEKTQASPMNAASFGKIIRHQFPQLTTRRLGTRGQSKYHYYGIAVKESSEYYEENFSSKVAESTPTEMTRKEQPRQSVAYSPRSKLGTLLPAFPEMKDIRLPEHLSETRVSTFLMMYRTHCQRILDTVIRANFDEVESYLLHFWQGMPTHMLCILDSQIIADIVGLCDSVLYKAIAGVLMPSVTQTLPESLALVIGTFSQRLEEWLQTAMEHLPELLCNVKFRMARYFSQLLERQTSLNHLCQAAKGITQNGEVTSQMAEDWSMVDVRTIVSQTLYAVQDMGPAPRLSKFCEQFQELLDNQSSLESYTNWLDKHLLSCVQKPLSGQSSKSVCQRSRQFMLTWSCFSTKVIRDMTLHSSPSFGSFHLLYMTLDEYIHYRVQTILTQDRADCLLCRLKGEADTSYEATEVLPSGTERRSIHTAATHQRFQHQFSDNSPSQSHDSTSPTSLTFDLQPILPSGQSKITPSYMACLESHDPVHLSSAMRGVSSFCQPASCVGFGECSSPPSIHSSGNSAFTPVTSFNSYASFDRPHSTRSLLHQQPNYARSSFPFTGFQNHGLLTNDTHSTYPGRETMLHARATQGNYNNQFEPVETRYGQFQLVPQLPNDSTGAFTKDHAIQDISTGRDHSFRHPESFDFRHEPSGITFHNATHNTDECPMYYSSNLCSEYDGKIAGSSIEIVEAGDLYIDEEEGHNGIATGSQYKEPYQHIQAVN
ncbi:regulatory factor X 4-like isoform X2 [Asterias amurensis]|uniref:regulatory factor X 4-like isoform X2 n=1 Tax=Asterias amurensis TaxID=7602 RepID=UPI003AB73293